MSEYLERICSGEADTQVLPRPSVAMVAPRNGGILPPRNIMLEERSIMLEERSIFMPDALIVEYGDVLSMDEKADLSARRAHGEPAHEMEASNAIDAYHESCDVSQLDRAIAVLLHLRKTKHPD